MKERLFLVLDALRARGVDYADIRVHDIAEERISTENLRAQDLATGRNRGYGVRVFAEGAMGFASSQDFERMEDVAETALRIARATALAQRNPVELAPKEPVVDHYQTSIEIDPFTVSRADKLELLFEAERKMRDSARLFRTEGSLDFRREEKIFADTDGSYITQTLYESGGGISAHAAGEGGMQTRSFPNSFRGNHATSGFEFVRDMELVENAPRTAEEAVQLLEAEECPSGRFDLVIDSSQMVLQIHESVGHPVELDRVLGHEAGYAGESFLKPDMIGFKYGSENVNIVADATAPGGLGTFGYDDEGVPAQRIEVITGGRFRNFLTSRDTAPLVSAVSNGTSRADGWGRIPIVRMTNINLLPGDQTLDGLIAGVESGLYLHTNKSWSIDDRRLNFQFACEIAYEIRDGRLTGKIYRDPIYTGITAEFWNSCDGVADEDHWQMFGTPNCGKGEPGQVAHVGHGAAPTRFRDVKVGVKDVG
ncbi:MAG: TldD/PmbA family protein [Bacillota bacterium]